MNLKEILQKIIDDGKQILLRDSNTDWEALVLLRSLSEPALKRQAHFQPGLYIADIDEAGYLDRVLYRVIQKI